MKLQHLLGVKGVFAPMMRTRLPTKLSYKIFRLLKKIETEEQFFNEKLQELLSEYGAKDEHGEYIRQENGIKMAEGKEEECNKAIAELNALEVEQPDIMFTLDELNELSLSVRDIVIMENFIKEG